MFRPSETYRQPSRSYPRVGPTICTKWFGPSIIPGPIFPSWTTSQPCSIDSGGNIFLQNEDPRINNQEGTTTGTPAGGVGPSLGGGGSDDRPTAYPAVPESDCPLSETPLDPPTGSCGGCFSTLDTRSSSGGAKRGGTLYHAGSILRCRSAGNNSLRSLARGGYDGGDTHVGIASVRPTLRAYSAPHYLHSALFPPKNSSALRVGGKPPVPANNTEGGGSRRTRDRAHSSDAGGRRKHETSLETEEMDAPCQHGQGGYLHRYKGFEQEKVWCPPVATFRVLGGLGEFQRRRANTAPAGKTRRNNNKNDYLPAEGGDPQLTQQQAASSIRSGTGGHMDSTYGLSEETPGSLIVELSHEASTEKEEASSAYPLELFAEGSRVEPVSPPPDEGDGATPAWCPRSKNRPRGAKRQTSWGSGAAQQRKPPLNKTASLSKVKIQADVALGSKRNSSRAARRFGAATASSSPYKKSSSAFLPYSLERPVSKERTRAFFYTSN